MGILANILSGVKEMIYPPQLTLEELEARATELETKANDYGKRLELKKRIKTAKTKITKAKTDLRNL